MGWPWGKSLGKMGASGFGRGAEEMPVTDEVKRVCMCVCWGGGCQMVRRL